MVISFLCMGAVIAAAAFWAMHGTGYVKGMIGDIAYDLDLLLVQLNEPGLFIMTETGYHTTERVCGVIKIAAHTINGKVYDISEFVDGSWKDPMAGRPPVFPQDNFAEFDGFWDRDDKCIRVMPPFYTLYTNHLTTPVSLG